MESYETFRQPRFWTLTGQRCVRADLFHQLQPNDVAGYRLEAALNWLCASRKLSVDRFLLDNVGSHNAGRENRARGALAKLRMFSAVNAGYARLFVRQVLLALQRRKKTTPPRDSQNHLFGG